MARISRRSRGTGDAVRPVCVCVCVRACVVRACVVRACVSVSVSATNRCGLLLAVRVRVNRLTRSVRVATTAVTA